MGMHYTLENINQLNSKGFTYLDNVLPLDLANQLYDTYIQEKEWDVFDQIREKHYSHVFKSPNPFLPQEGEIYSARFNRSISLESNEIIKNAFNNYLIPLIQQISPFKMSEYDVRCYKLESEDHYRTHIDDYAGTINMIYYVNKEWRWDWGGILNVLSHDDLELCESIFPKFNRVVLLNNKVFRSPHFVSTVEKYALNPRYSIVSFNK